MDLVIIILNLNLIKKQTIYIIMNNNISKNLLN